MAGARQGLKYLFYPERNEARQQQNVLMFCFEFRTDHKESSEMHRHRPSVIRKGVIGSDPETMNRDVDRVVHVFCQRLDRGMLKLVHFNR